MNLGAPSASRRGSYKHDSVGLRSSVRQSTWLLQRAFMRCTVVACHTVERPEGVRTSRSVRNLASDLAGASAISISFVTTQAPFWQSYAIECMASLKYGDKI